MLSNILEHVCQLPGDGASCLKPGEKHNTVGTGYVPGQPVQGKNRDTCKLAGSMVTGNHGTCFVIGDSSVPLQDESNCWEKEHPPPPYSASQHPVDLDSALGHHSGVNYPANLLLKTFF